MKKLVSVLLAVAMLLCCCGALAEDYVGLWTLDTIESGELVLPASTLGMTFTIDLVADGTANLDAMGEKEVGTWTAIAGGINLTDASGTNMDMLLVDGKLVMSQDGMKMVFARVGEDSAPAAAAVAADLTAATLPGHWALTSASAEGLTLPTAMLGMTMEFTLNADGTGNYKQDVQGQKLETAIGYRAEGTDPMVVTLFVSAGDLSQDILALTEMDGKLSVTADNGVILFFELQK